MLPNPEVSEWHVGRLGRRVRSSRREESEFAGFTRMGKRKVGNLSPPHLEHHAVDGEEDDSLVL